MSSSPYELESLIDGYSLCAASEGKSPKTISGVISSVARFARFLKSQAAPTDVREIAPLHIRAFIVFLQQKNAFDEHPYIPEQPRHLSPYSVNSYLRAIRAFWSWLLCEEIIEENPFVKVKVPKAPKKIIATFSPDQIRDLLAEINTESPEGYRDYTFILTLLDTGLRLSELTNLTMDNVSLKEGLLKVMGKGGKERIVPIGRSVQQLIWRYISIARPRPAYLRLRLKVLDFESNLF